jgi:lipid II:glycine glycyltransferase (peptidoglycan interpeptide bridge formation enzyme)
MTDVAVAVSPAVGPTAGRTASVQELREDPGAWDAFVQRSDAASHLQLTAWATVKHPNGWRAVRVVADGGSGPIGAQVLVRRLGPGPFGVGYAPRGPIATAFDVASIGAFGQAVRRVARRLRLTHVTIDPGIEDSAVRARLLAAGWRTADPIQHDRTRLIDLAQTESALWGDLRPTTRNLVRRARKEGITVEAGTLEDLDAFYTIMQQTAARAGFIIRSADTYRAVLEAFAPSGSASLLFARLADGTPAAAKIVLRAGGLVIPPYSGMTDEGARLSANRLLEWEAIRSEAEAGARTYDMWGLAHPGIALYKAGFGGREVSYIGTFDLPTLPLLRDAVVRARRGYVWLARRRHGLAGSDGQGSAEGPVG